MCGTGRPAVCSKPWNDSEAAGIAFLRRLVEELHSQANTQHRLLQDGNDGVETALAQAGHGVGGRAHAGKYDVARGANFNFVRGHGRGDLQPLQRELQRCDVGAAVGDDHD
jgi:hypothetical protein